MLAHVSCCHQVHVGTQPHTDTTRLWQVPSDRAQSGHGLGLIGGIPGSTRRESQPNAAAVIARCPIGMTGNAVVPPGNSDRTRGRPGWSHDDAVPILSNHQSKRFPFLYCLRQAAHNSEYRTRASTDDTTSGGALQHHRIHHSLLGSGRSPARCENRLRLAFRSRRSRTVS
jgi:hypothetical protein